MRTILLFVFILLSYASPAQYFTDDFVGKWCAIDRLEIKVNDTIKFVKGKCEEVDVNYMNWEMMSNMDFIRRGQVKVIRENSPPVFDIYQWKSENWSYYNETNMLFLGSEKYSILNLNDSNLMVLRVK